MEERAQKNIKVIRSFLIIVSDVEANPKDAQTSAENERRPRTAPLDWRVWWVVVTSCFTTANAMYKGFEAYQMYEGWENSTTRVRVNLVWGLVSLVVEVGVVLCYGPLVYRWLRGRG
ncbi:hypothetical protein F4819DRAFT_482728 [Hypoxylon fuscum]|nr:hypothetical protein F4819DRAFT_482728 [Hypoxylon fuscum]